MTTTAAQARAFELMRQFGLIDAGWRFAWDRAVRRFGRCSYVRKTISLSIKLVVLNRDEDVEDTIRHEIAHALIGPGFGHGHVWKAKARAIGARPRACATAAEGKRTLQGSIVATCWTCGNVVRRHRVSRRKTACGACCNKYNGGRFSERYLLTFRRESARAVIREAV